jgi:PAS domain S-box-containing protein
MAASEQIDRQFEALAASAPDAILTIDVHSTILFANAAVLRVFGYMPEELVGRNLGAVIPDRLRAAHDAGLARYLRTGLRHVPWTGLELRAVRRDGSEIPVEISFGEFLDADGNRVFSGFVRDLSERVRQQEELEHARATAESALAELARIGRITDAAIGQATYDEMLRELLGHLRQELGADEATVMLLDSSANELRVGAALGVEEEDDAHDSMRVRVGAGLSGRVAATGEPMIIDDVTSSDVVNERLRREFASLAAVPVRNDGQTVGVLHIGSRTPRRFTEADLRVLQIVADRMAGALARTLLFEAERHLRDEEHALRALAQAISAAVDVREIMSKLADGAVAISAASGAYIEQIVAPGGEVEILAACGEGVPEIGQRVPFPGSLTEEIIARREPVFLVRMEGIGGAIAPYLDEHCHGCSALVVPLFAADQTLGTLVLLRRPDEPPFPQAAVDRLRTVADLASVALQRLAAFAESERQRAEAQAAVRSRDEMLSIVSHDLRNPVSTVLMSAGLLADSEIPLSEDERRKQLEVIARAAHRMNRLIQDLLDVARIERGGLPLTCRCEDPAAMVAEVCEAFRTRAATASIELRSETAECLPKLHVDRDRVVQVLSNYLDNALKFTAEGGSISVRAELGDGGGIRFAVQDTGSGIPADDMPHVFDRFWQAKRTAHLGTGLGLAISKGIAEAHRGSVGVESTPGVGTTFWLILPASNDC